MKVYAGRIPIVPNTPQHSIRSLFLWNMMVSAALVAILRMDSSAITRQQIKFEDIKPAACTLSQCWSGMGMDGKERVFIGFTSTCGTLEDFVIFMYNPSNQTRRLISTMRTTSGSAGNLLTNEAIPKGHTHFVDIGNKLYMGSQSFHDFKQELAGLDTMRGSHLYSYDLTRDDTLYDISNNFPKGVLQEHQGMIACAAIPATTYLVGLSHPYSDILLFNTATQRMDTIVPGIPWRLWNVVSRDIIAAKTGKIYIVRNPEAYAMRDTVNPMYTYDIATKQFGPTSTLISAGYIGCQSPTRDGNKIYFTTVCGKLYVIDVSSGGITFLKNIPVTTSNPNIWAMSLSYDETKIYTIVSVEGKMYEYNIASKTIALVMDLGSGFYTGSNMRDSKGNLYFAGFASNFGSVRLEVLNINDRTGAPNIVKITSPAGQIATAGAPYSYTITATGTPAPAISVSDLPSWLSFNAAAAAITGTPQTSDIGATGAITVTTANTQGGHDAQIFKITVNRSLTGIATAYRTVRQRNLFTGDIYSITGKKVGRYDATHCPDKISNETRTSGCGVYLVKSNEGVHLVLVTKGHSL